jgi:hypothetical protein
MYIMSVLLLSFSGAVILTQARIQGGGHSRWLSFSVVVITMKMPLMCSVPNNPLSLDG